MRVQVAIFMLLLMLAQSVTCEDLKNATITGNLTVKKGETLNLNCSAESNSHPLNISWSFRGASGSLQNKTTDDTLTITSVSSEHAGEYVCTVQKFNLTLNTSVKVTVIDQPMILNNSTCFQLEKSLKCSCLCKDVEGRLNGSVVNSTIRINGMTCGCENDAGNKISGKGETENLLSVRSILTFLVGAASTAVIFCIALCFVGMCIRCGTVKAVDGNANKADVKLDAVKIQHNSAGTDQAEEDEHTPLRGRPAAAATHTAAVNGEVKVEDTPGEDRPSGEEKAAGEKEQNEVDYACIDYSLLQDRGAEAQKEQSEETEYAEIQIKKQAEEEGAEDLQGEEVQGEAQGLENQEQVEGEEEEIQV
ncbi:sialic acid-binding Ig-like lectin 10 isoform X2 [Astyanax mexicanus]|uniref:sialic acid-binding Ig-like lectin 10 isoform X2 n=1 Tax=Astyanax mexicanus TaxID=7994 RepID=UPI0020CB0BB9|nr:sialic acid-binding Ig-like lectin 10 isoform X2 [Astyanax mexicanus]